MKTSNEHSQKAGLKSLPIGILDSKNARKLVKRLLEYEQEFYQFIDRFFAHKHLGRTDHSQSCDGSQSYTRCPQRFGKSLTETLLMSPKTCEQQSGNLLDYMTEVLDHYLHGSDAHSLIRF